MPHKNYCVAECHALIEQTRTVKKALDKSYRQLEKVYKFADKQLKSKDDKRWKDSNLRDFKKLGDLLGDFHEAINPAMPLEFKTIEKSAVLLAASNRMVAGAFPRCSL